MKQLVEYLSINVKNKNILKSDISNRIMDYFMISKEYSDKEQYKEACKFIDDWIVSNGIDKWINDDNVEEDIQFILACDGSTWINLLKSLKGYTRKAQHNILMTKFQTDDHSVILCNQERQHQENKESFSKVGLSNLAIGVDMWTTESMIACVTGYGTIYCWTNKDYFEKLDELTKK